jgi:hypothetical protein
MYRWEGAGDKLLLPRGSILRLYRGLNPVEFEPTLCEKLY